MKWLRYEPSTVLDIFRLYYLYQDTMLNYMKEERFFTHLSRLHLALSGIFVSMLLGENFCNSNEFHTIFIWHSSCRKIPIHWEESNWSVYYNVHAVSGMILIFIAFGTQIALFKRKRQLEKLRADGIMVINYNRDGVTISRRTPDQLSCQKLWRHNRTVVTPKASFLSFLLSLVTLLSDVFFFYLGPSGESGPSIYWQLHLYIIFGRHFFLHSFIETIFSPSLLNTLTDVLPCRRRAYHVVNV